MAEDEIRALNAKVDRILFYLNDDPSTGKQGLVHKLERLAIKVDDFISEYNRKESIRKTRVAMFGAIGSGVILFLRWLAEKIVEHFHLF